MHPNGTVETTRITDLMVTYDELCALTRDLLVAGEYDAAIACTAVGIEKMQEVHQAQVAVERLAFIRAAS